MATTSSISLRQPPAISYSPLVLLLTPLAAGIVIDRCLPLSAGLWWCLSAVCLAMWLPVWWKAREEIASCVLLASVLAAGGSWHHAYWRLYAPHEISRGLDEIMRPIVVEATAITSPRWVPAPPPTPLRTIPKGEHCQLLVWITAVRDRHDYRPASGWATLQVEGRCEHIRAGDRVRIMAHGAKPAAPLNPGEFDFALHERSRRAACRLFAEFPECVERLSRGSPWSPRRWLADLRSGGAAILASYIAPERSDLASAILLGTREQLDPDRNENYLVTGTIHVLSISGMHVGILAAGFFVVIRAGLVPRQATLAATILLTFGYAILVDLEPPVVRATILVVVACLALWTGRTAIGFNVLAAAAIIVLAMNPASLFQAGTQLSFLAVATMIAFQSWLIRQPIADPLDRLIATTRPRLVRVSRELVGIVWRVWFTGALIWLVSTPLVWRQYNLISPVALILNFLMWIPVTFAMYAGMGTLLFGSLVPLTGRICGLACDRCLELLERVIATGRDWPGSFDWLAAPPLWWVGLFYAALGVFLAFPPVRPPRRWLLALSSLWIAGALLLSGQSNATFARLYRQPLTCHFVAIGHGIAVLVELPNGKNLLYDSGRLGSPVSGVRPVSAVLWSRGIKHIDAIVISHADADHFNAIPDLLERFSVGVVYVSPIMFERLPAAVRELRDAIERARVPLREVYAGQRLASGSGAVLEILHPPQRGVLGSDNANSIVLSIAYAGRRILLTGDLEPPGLGELLAEEPLDYDVVLAPHHGSPRSNPGTFADWSKPKTVIISGSRSLGDIPTIEGVKQSFRLRGAEIFHTAEDGCIRVEISPAGFSTLTFRPHVRALPGSIGATNLMQTD